ncbi:MAG TPA: TIM44-like domain-containing protein [Albitalea sp.]|nr:TIM44-like domain-containing protein [Albitalea sp.]
MKRILASLIIAALSVGLLVGEAEAKRLGGGGSSGLRRPVPTQRTPDAPPVQPGQPAQQAAPSNTAGAAAAPAPAPRRSWLGPIAGLAAGLGLAALMSHLGLGAEFGSILMMVLLGLVGVMLVRFVMNRMRGNAHAPQGLQYAGAGWQNAPGAGASTTASSAAPAGVASAAPISTAPIPAGFDTAGFERAAKMIFIRMQAANDAADLEDLRQFATPEMFAAFRLELQERGSKKQQTDVVKLEAQVLDVAEEPSRQVVSVRFHGLIREDIGAPAEPFDEVWHLVKPSDGSREWAIAGIQQNATA